MIIHEISIQHDRRDDSLCFFRRSHPLLEGQPFILPQMEQRGEQSNHLLTFLPS